MSELLYTVAIIAFLPLVWASVGVYIRFRSDIPFDNRNPRKQIAALSGLGSRVYAAQQNAWEAVAMFTPCAFIAHSQIPNSQNAGIVSIVFVFARIVHGLMYCFDFSVLRSVAWFAGVGACVYLVYLAS